MGRRSEPPGKPAPDTWASSLFSRPDLKTFLTLVEADLRARNIAYVMVDGAVEIDFPEGRQELGFENLAQVCTGTSTLEWPAVIHRHFDLVFLTREEEHRLEALLTDFEAVRPMLRLRLYGSVAFAEQVSWQLSDGLVAALVLDLPTFMRSVRREEIASFEISHDDLFDVALENLKTEVEGEAGVLDAPGGARITVVEGPSFYTSTRALNLASEALLEDHPYGAIVSIPARHVFFHHVIEGSQVVDAVRALAALAHHAHRRGPGSVSPHLFWVRGGGRFGRWERIACEVDDRGAMQVSPPSAFVRDVLDRVTRQPS
jgi:hypothetical protein